MTLDRKLIVAIVPGEPLVAVAIVPFDAPDDGEYEWLTLEANTARKIADLLHEAANNVDPRGLRG